jgi:NhaA family Na+:H+ antiporter
VILPLFAAANTCIPLGGDWLKGVGDANSLGIIAGLAIGKPLGIWLFSFLSVVMGLSVLPEELKWKHIIGAGCLGGIGFTMSIFITLLAFNDTEIINHSKIAILIASLVAGLCGILWLKFSLRQNTQSA